MNTQVSSAFSLRRPLREGATGPHVRNLQRRLRELGIASVEEDGLYGFQTKMAVENLQRLMRIRRDGVVGKHTAALLAKSQLPICIESYVARAGDTPRGVARRQGIPLEALLRGSGIRTGAAGPLSEGQRLFVIGRVVLGVGCGYLRPSTRGWAGPATGAVFDIGPDGAATPLDGADEADARGCIPVFRFTADPSFLLQASSISKAARQIRSCADRVGACAVLVTLPGTRGPLARRLSLVLRAVRNEMPRSVPLIAAVPLLDHGRARFGSPVLNLRTALRSADYCILMAWRDLAAPGSLGPIAPLPWVVSSVKRAIREVEPWRVLLGLCGCAVRRRPDTGEVEPIPYAQIGRILAAYATEGEWDTASASASFSCRRRGVENEYRYENSLSLKLKALFADRLNLAGMAVFDASSVDPEAMGHIEQVFKRSVGALSCKK